MRRCWWRGEISAQMFEVGAVACLEQARRPRAGIEV
eukprot:SAG25_NODE_7416_length_481_cov_4.408377_1_plen_35_part_01